MVDRSYKLWQSPVLKNSKDVNYFTLKTKYGVRAIQLGRTSARKIKDDPQSHIKENKDILDTLKKGSLRYLYYQSKLKTLESAIEGEKIIKKIFGGKK